MSPGTGPHRPPRLTWAAAAAAGAAGAGGSAVAPGRGGEGPGGAGPGGLRRSFPPPGHRRRGVVVLAPPPGTQRGGLAPSGRSGVGYRRLQPRSFPPSWELPVPSFPRSVVLRFPSGFTFLCSPLGDGDLFPLLPARHVSVLPSKLFSFSIIPSLAERQHLCVPFLIACPKYVLYLPSMTFQTTLDTEEGFFLPAFRMSLVTAVLRLPPVAPVVHCPLMHSF